MYHFTDHENDKRNKEIIVLECFTLYGDLFTTFEKSLDNSMFGGSSIYIILLF